MSFLKMRKNNKEYFMIVSTPVSQNDKQKYKACTLVDTVEKMGVVSHQ